MPSTNKCFFSVQNFAQKTLIIIINLKPTATEYTDPNMKIEKSL